MSRDKALHKEQIMKAALKLFEEKGYEQVSISEICKEAGMSRTVFYSSFASKSDIIKEELERVVSKDLVHSLDGFMSAPNDYERIFALCDHHQALPLKLGPKLTLTMRQLDLEGKLDVWGVSHTLEGWLIRLTENCQASGIIRNTMPAERITRVCIDASIQVTNQWCKQDGAFSLRARTREVLETIFDTAPKYCLSKEQLAKL